MVPLKETIIWRLQVQSWLQASNNSWDLYPVIANRIRIGNSWYIKVFWETKEFVLPVLKSFYFHLNFYSFLLCKMYCNLGNRFCKHQRWIKNLCFLTKNTFDFQNSAIFVFVHDKNKRRIIETCSITCHNTIPQQGLFKISPSLGKIIQK